jgi:6-phosphogluconolactonase
MLILVTGSGKADAVRRWRRGEELPVAQVAAAAPSMVYIDRAAAGLASG